MEIESGTAERTFVGLSGSGDVEAEHFVVQTLKVSNAGSGDVEMTVEDSIEAALVGSGSILYNGDPENVDVNRVGSGEVRRRDG